MYSRRFSTLPAIGALTLIYFIAGKFGLKLAFLHASASPVWPPAGIALAALLLLGYRVWPAIFVGAFLVNATTAGNIATSLGIAAGNTLEAVCGAWLVNRFAGGTGVFDRAQDVFKFALAAMLSTLVSPIGQTTSRSGRRGGWATTPGTWWSLRSFFSGASLQRSVGVAETPAKSASFSSCYLFSGKRFLGDGFQFRLRITPFHSFAGRS